jgi:hypothetical protein
MQDFISNYWWEIGVILFLLLGVMFISRRYSQFRFDATMFALLGAGWFFGYYSPQGVWQFAETVYNSPDYWSLFMVIYLAMPIVLGLVMYGLAGYASLTDEDGVLTVKPNRFKPDGYNANAEGELQSDPSYPKSDFGFFTKIQPEQVKVLVLGAAFYDAIMDTPGYTFRHLTTWWPMRSNDPTRWDIIEHRGKHRDAYPISAYNWLSWKTVLFGPYRVVWYLWQVLAYESFKVVFTGFWPIIRLRVYPLEYFRETKTAGGAFGLRRKNNYSDHYRLDFQLFVPIDKVDTSNLIPITMFASIIMGCANIYRAAFRSDDNWTSRLFARIPSVINEFVGSLKVQQALARGESREKLTEQLWEVLKPLADLPSEPGKRGGPIYEIGFGFVGDDPLTLPDRSATNPEDTKALGAPARAEALKLARFEEAEGEAAAIRKSGLAVNEAGEGGLVIASIEGNVRAAEAAGQNGGIAIVGGQQAVDGGSAAILAELRRLNRNLENGSDT